MSTVIEILDSDDNSNEGIVESLLIPKIEISENSADRDNYCIKKEIMEVPSGSNSNAKNENIVNKEIKKIKNRRKSAHQLLRISPEMEFETVLSNNTLIEQQKKVKEKVQKSQKRPLENVLADSHKKLMNTKETREILKKIAKERVAINCLLNLYNMPEINFSIQTPPDLLLCQFEDRLRARKLRGLQQTPQTGTEFVKIKLPAKGQSKNFEVKKEDNNLNNINEDYCGDQNEVLRNENVETMEETLQILKGCE